MKDSWIIKEVRGIRNSETFEEEYFVRILLLKEETIGSTEEIAKYFAFKVRIGDSVKELLNELKVEVNKL